MGILSIDDLATAVREHQSRGRRVVLCHGVFDLLHIGHIRYLQQARSMGDVLVVTLTADRYVDKGPHRPAFPETLRAEGLASLAAVDHVADVRVTVERRDKTSDLRPLLETLLRATGAGLFAVTQGKQGCVIASGMVC